MCENRIFPGYRKIGRKLKCHHRTAKRLVQEAKLHVQHRKKVPKSNEKQQKTQQKRMNRLCRAIGKAWVVMNDETYFDSEGHPLSDNCEQRRKGRNCIIYVSHDALL